MPIVPRTPTAVVVDRAHSRGAPAAAWTEIEGVLTRVRDALAERPRVVLAVSGGLDSAVLLDAASRVAARERLLVATFDHGTGPEATRAVEHVLAVCATLGVRARAGRAAAGLRGELAWRTARWSFLREVAAGEGGPVVTAHTRDDHLETVVLRALRGAGPRGLAALLAPSPGVLRPLLAVTRDHVAAYAAAAGVCWIDDPSNATLGPARNRVRHQLLPAMRAARPTIDAELAAVAAAAAVWRTGVDALAERLVEGCGAGGVRVARHTLAGYDEKELAVLWPALAARAGVTLDRRGTRRLSAFTRNASTGTSTPLSGGARVVCGRDDWIVVRGGASVDAGETPLTDGAVHGEWRFDRRDDASDEWSAELPAGARLTVRAWRPGDRLCAAGAPTARRVKRWLADAGLSGPERRGWPVVLADDEIVWIPGVRRSDAASVRPGRPGLRYACERNLR